MNEANSTSLQRVLGTFILSLLSSGCGASDGFEYEATGSMADIEAHIERLIAGAETGPVLVIQVVNSPDFIQFSAAPRVVQIDFPLVTPEQRAREGQIRAFFMARDLEIIENYGSDGTRFLDVDLRATAAGVASLTAQAFVELFGTPSDAALNFSGDGLGVAP